MFTAALAIFLLAISGTLSGLTLGILALSPQMLKHKKELGDAHAAKLYPLRKNGTQLLITLVLANVAANAFLTILLGNILFGPIAVVVATVLITVFTEILPQATIGRYGLRFAPPFTPLVSFLMKVLGPVVRPVARLLDSKIGKELSSVMTKKELQKMVQEHSKQPGEGNITQHEERIISHTLSLSERLVSSVMTPRRMIRAIEKSEVVGPKLLDELHKSGLSRFPVYDIDLEHIVGMLYIRDLVKHGTKGKQKAGDLADDEVNYVNEDQSLEHVLDAFLKTKHHLFIAINEFRETVGVISIEDVLEQIIGSEIVDESDRYDDLREVAMRAAKPTPPNPPPKSTTTSNIHKSRKI